MPASRSFVIIIFFSLLLGGGHAAASEAPPEWNGVVADLAGKPVAAANVQLRSLSDGRDFMAQTNPAGHFSFAGVPAGKYAVQVSVNRAVFTASASVEIKNSVTLTSQ